MKQRKGGKRGNGRKNRIKALRKDGGKGNEQMLEIANHENFINTKIAINGIQAQDKRIKREQKRGN